MCQIYFERRAALLVSCSCKDGTFPSLWACACTWSVTVSCYSRFGIGLLKRQCLVVTEKQLSNGFQRCRIFCLIIVVLEHAACTRIIQIIFLHCVMATQEV